MFFYIFPQDIALEIYGVAGLSLAQIGVRVGVGNDGDLREAIFPARHGQADAVDGNGALRNDVAREIFRNFDGQAPAIALAPQLRDPSGGVHMALYEVAAKVFFGGERSFEVHHGPGFQHRRMGAERSLADGLAGKIGGKTFWRQ